MYKSQRVGVVLAAAGSGSRMKSEIPKQFIKIDGEPIIAMTYKKFAKCEWVDNIYVVTREEDMHYCKEMIVPYLTNEELKKFTGIVSGGKERQDSVYRTLQAIREQNYGIEIVLIHDAARPFVTQKNIEEVIEATYKRDAAVVCVKPKDTIRTEDKTLDRNKLFMVQTPQGFRFDLLMEAYEKATEDEFYGTDECSLVERIGVHPTIIEGDYTNIKITTPEDMPMEIRIGKGYDVHRLVEDRKCVIGGVDIPYEKGLLGHSDADVLTHAIMDAILGAAGLGDIGRLFPDSDEKYKGANSLKLLEIVGEVLERKGYKVGNIDATVICERPKISQYNKEMIENISKSLKIDNSHVNIKGTTTEKLGFTGRAEGIAAEAVCIIKTK